MFYNRYVTIVPLLRTILSYYKIKLKQLQTFSLMPFSHINNVLNVQYTLIIRMNAVDQSRFIEPYQFDNDRHPPLKYTHVTNELFCSLKRLTKHSFFLFSRSI